MQQKAYCLLSEKPDNAKSDSELAEEIIESYRKGIEEMRAYAGERKRP